MTQAETECPQDVWFANQIPDFACASVALLNIVNNIRELDMGKEMRDFKDFTTDLDPMARGDAIDGFDFLKRIHNSFAREADLLNADMHMRNKMNQAKKRKAALEAQATKKAKRATDAPEKRADSAIASPTRKSRRTQRPVTNDRKLKNEIPDSDASSPLSDPPDSDPEYAAKSKPENHSSSPAEQAPRRSGRQPKPRKDPLKLFSEADAQLDPDGFHYVAYLPVDGRVWKLDGLDSYPHLVGDFDAEGGGTWTNVACPEIQARMMMFEGSIEYSLMAVVHDPMVAAKAELARNVKELQVIDARLSETCAGWKTRDGAEESGENVVLGPDPVFELANTDLEAALPRTALEKEISTHQDVYIDDLFKLRKERMKAQASLRGSVRAELVASRDDDEKARLRRHDFGSFVKGWLGGLAEQEVLKAMVDEEGAAT